MNEALLEKKPIDSDEHDGPKVAFEHVASLQDVKFRVDWSATLQSAWDEAYRQLAEPKRPEDRLQNDDGQDLMNKLGWTFRQLFDCRRRSNIDPPCRFNIDPGMDANRVAAGCG